MDHVFHKKKIESVLEQKTIHTDKNGCRTILLSSPCYKVDNFTTAEFVKDYTCQKVIILAFHNFKTQGCPHETCFVQNMIESFLLGEIWFIWTSLSKT